MNHHEIEKARRCLRTAGTVEDRAHIRQAAMARLKDEIEVTAQRKEASKKDFRERLEKWETRTVPENAPVVARPGDRHDSWLYRLTGWIALLSETGLAAWIFLRLHVPAWIGALTALGITFTLHGVFLFACENEDRPKETVDRVKRYAAIPAIVGFLIALAGGALARYVTGNLAYMLLPLFSFSLWLGTLSLIVLAASLFTIAHLRGWASRHENEYHQLDSEERASASFLRELLQEEQRTAAPGQMRKPTLLLPEAVSQGKHTISLVILLAAVLFANSGCTGIASDETAGIDTATQSQASVEPEESGADLHVFIDWSGSCVRPALDEALSTVKLEVPAIVEN